MIFKVSEITLSNSLAIWHSFPDITHIYVNNGLKSAIFNLNMLIALIALRFFKAHPFPGIFLSETAHFVLCLMVQLSGTVFQAY